MKLNLSGRTVQVVNFTGLVTQDAPPISLRGIYGGEDLVTAISIDGTTLERRLFDTKNANAAESVDEFRIRAACELVPKISGDAIRDANDYPVGYLIYTDLPADYCKP
jgi:hypothetical protein